MLKNNLYSMSGNRLSYSLQQLQGKSVVVTGASGFIGGRIVHMLQALPGIQVRAVINNYHRAINLVRRQTPLAKADITNYAQVLKAIQGADVVIHCAYVSRGSFDEQAANTLLGCQNVFKACVEAGVKHVVYLSTMSVYGIHTSGPLNENCPNKTSNFFYSDAKIKCEELAFEYYRKHKLPMVVIQPTIVYGPGSSSWIVSPLKQMQKAYKVLPDDGGGICNPVYVDDVAQACILAATGDKGVGERFLISGNEHLTWKAYYGFIEQMLGEPGIKLEPYESIKQKLAAKDQKPSTFSIIWKELRKERTRNFLRQITLFRVLFTIGRKLLPDSLKHKLRGNTDNPTHNALPKPIPTVVQEKPVAYEMLFSYDVHRAKPVASITKAKEVLGYEPKFDLKKGMALTEKWAAWAGYLPTKP